MKNDNIVIKKHLCAQNYTQRCFLYSAVVCPIEGD